MAFESLATDLVAGPQYGRSIFVVDLDVGVAERVSVKPDGTPVTGCAAPSISGDGRVVAFDCHQSVIPDGGIQDRDVYVRDRLSATTERASVSPDVEHSLTHSDHAAISNDGRYVAFNSRWGLYPSARGRDFFVRDRQEGITEMVSAGPDGMTATFDGVPSISGDGRFVAFESDRADLVVGDSNGSRDVFVHDRMSGRTILASTSLLMEPANHGAEEPAISADGRYASFSSGSTNLAGDDVNATWDVFTRFVRVPAMISVSPGSLPAAATTPIIVHGEGFESPAILTLAAQGVTLSDVVVVDNTTITANAVVAANAPSVAANVTVTNLGNAWRPDAGAVGLCVGCVVVNGT